MGMPLVEILMGSDSDIPIMGNAGEIAERLEAYRKKTRRDLMKKSYELRKAKG